MTKQKDVNSKQSPMTPEEIERSKTYNGEVRISLQTYHDLISSSTKHEVNANKYNEAMAAVTRYLTFLRSRKDIPFDDIMKDFNKENPDLTMYIDDNGRVRLNLNLTS